MAISRAGLIQLSGRANQARSGATYEADPDQVMTSAGSVQCAVDYWRTRGFNAAADADDIARVTRLDQRRAPRAGGADGADRPWKGCLARVSTVAAGLRARYIPRFMTDDREQTRLARARFRAWRRGFREADLVLGPFVDSVGPSLSPAELGAFEVLLDADDYALYGWITGTGPTPHEHETPVMGKIREFMRDHVAAAVAEGAG